MSRRAGSRRLEVLIALAASSAACVWLAPRSSAVVACDGALPTVPGATSGNDTLEGTPGPDVIVGLAGDDDLLGFGGDDLICGGSGKDAIRPGLGNDRVDGGEGPDPVEYLDPEHAAGVTVDLSMGVATAGGGEMDELAGIENIAGSDGPDILIGDAVNNTMIGFGGDDWIEGGEGDADGAWYPRGATVASLAGGTAVGSGQGQDQLIGVEILQGSPEADVLIGDGEINVLDGREGDDLLYGRGGSDSLRAAEGSDDLFGGEGLDSSSYTESSGRVEADLASRSVLERTGADALTGVEIIIGSRFADTLRGDEGENLFFGGAGDDLIDGRDGADTVAYFASTSVDGQLTFDTGPAEVDLRSGEGFNRADEGQFQGDRLIDIEDVWGSSRADVIHGNHEPNQIFGDSGDDNLFGRGGDDAITGDSGDDRVLGGRGDGDFVDYLFASGSIQANLAKGRVVVGSEFDRVRGFEIFAGTDFADVIRGRRQPDLLLGASGADRIFGLAGDDALRGGRATGDFLNGGSGRDHCKDDRRFSCERKVLPRGLRDDLLQALAQRLRDIRKRKGRSRSGI